MLLKFLWVQFWRQLNTSHLTGTSRSSFRRWINVVRFCKMSFFFSWSRQRLPYVQTYSAVFCHKSISCIHKQFRNAWFWWLFTSLQSTVKVNYIADREATNKRRSLLKLAIHKHIPEYRWDKKMREIMQAKLYRTEELSHMTMSCDHKVIWHAHLDLWVPRLFSCVYGRDGVGDDAGLAGGKKSPKKQPAHTRWYCRGRERIKPDWLALEQLFATRKFFRSYLQRQWVCL